MAVLAAAVHPSPASPPPARGIVARRVRSRLAAAAADAVICLFLASMWLFFGSLTTAEIGKLACGEGCPVVVAASKVLIVAAVTFALVLPFVVVPLIARAAGVGTDIEAAKAPAPTHKSFRAAAWEALRDPIMLAFLASMPFVLLLVVGALLEGNSHVKGSRRERMGPVIYEVGALGMDAVDFFVACPILTVRTWRAWRTVRPAL